MTKKFKQNCVCKHCGNEGEMEITCSLAIELFKNSLIIENLPDNR